MSIVYGTYVRCDRCGAWCPRSVLGPQTSHTLAIERAAQAGWVRIPYRGQKPNGRGKQRHLDLCRRCVKEAGDRLPDLARTA